MNELEGCKILRSRFEAAGLSIIENFHFDEEGITVALDGFDPLKRIGYEYITTETGDLLEFTPLVVERIEARIAEDELFILLIDEKVEKEENLVRAADGFLAQLRAKGRL